MQLKIISDEQIYATATRLEKSTVRTDNAKFVSLRIFSTLD